MATATTTRLNDVAIFPPKSIVIKSHKQKKEKVATNVIFHDVELPSDLRDFYLEKKPLSFLKNLQYAVYTDINDCFELWEEFSPKESLFDLWDFRFAFYRAYQHQPHFILLKKGERKLGLLPLWYEKEKEKYFWFGSWWQEDNKLFLKDPIFAPILMKLCLTPVYLNALSPSVVSHLVANEEFKKFEADDPKYILDLSDIKDFNDYLIKLKKSRRHNLKKDRKRIEAQNPEIIINNFSDLDNLVALSLERFRQKKSAGYEDQEDDDPGWEDVRRVESFRRAIELSGKSYQIRMITIKIGGKVAGVDLIAIHKDCYYALVCGYDVNRFPSIGNYFNILEIEEALRMGLKKIDFLQNNYQWKDRWFQAVPLLMYEKK